MLYIGALIVLFYYGDTYDEGTLEYDISNSASYILIILLGLSAFLGVLTMFW
jgi:hypothetical protein